MRNVCKNILDDFKVHWYIIFYLYDLSVSPPLLIFHTLVNRKLNKYILEVLNKTQRPPLPLPYCCQILKPSLWSIHVSCFRSPLLLHTLPVQISGKCGNDVTAWRPWMYKTSRRLLRSSVLLERWSWEYVYYCWLDGWRAKPHHKIL